MVFYVWELFFGEFFSVGKLFCGTTSSTEQETIKNVVAYGKLLEEEGLPPIPFTHPPYILGWIQPREIVRETCGNRAWEGCGKRFGNLNYL